MGFPPSVLEKKVHNGVREPGKMSEVFYVLLIQSLQQSACVVPLGSGGCEFGPELVLKKGGARGVQKIPLQEKVLHHRETSPPHAVRNEVRLEIRNAGKRGDVTYSVRERERFQIFGFY